MLLQMQKQDPSTTQWMMEYVIVLTIAYYPTFLKISIDQHVSFSVNYAIKQNNELVCQHNCVVHLKFILLLSF